MGMLEVEPTQDVRVAKMPLPAFVPTISEWEQARDVIMNPAPPPPDFDFDFSSEFQKDQRTPTPPASAHATTPNALVNPHAATPVVHATMPAAAPLPAHRVPSKAAKAMATTAVVNAKRDNFIQ